MRFRLALLGLLALIGLFTAIARADAGTPQARIPALLAAYSAKDIPGFMKMLDPSAAMYGSAEREFFTTPEGIRGLLDTDYKQWRSASFGAPSHETTQRAGELETVFFDAPLTIVTADGASQTFTIRFATVWRLRDGQWRVVQSMNATAQ